MRHCAKKTPNSKNSWKNYATHRTCYWFYYHFREIKKSSSIVTTVEEAKQLQDWVEESASGKVRFELLWKGTRDGFGASVFHTKCNNKGPTLTIIKSNNDKIFGGYTSQSWGFGGGSWTSKHDATAFIYSLSYKTKCATQKDTNSIWDSSGYGPIFGDGYDIAIYDNCNARSDNYCNPSTYALPAGKDNTFLAGSSSFTVKEIEVYAVMK